jgi:hypothetical protein
MYKADLYVSVVSFNSSYSVVITSNVYGRHRGLVDRYGMSVSQMTTDMFHSS